MERKAKSEVKKRVFTPLFPSCLGKQCGHAEEPSIMVIGCEMGRPNSGSTLFHISSSLFFFFCSPSLSQCNNEWTKQFD